MPAGVNTAVIVLSANGGTLW